MAQNQDKLNLKKSEPRHAINLKVTRAEYREFQRLARASRRCVGAEVAHLALMAARSLNLSGGAV